MLRVECLYHVGIFQKKPEGNNQFCGHCSHILDGWAYYVITFVYEIDLILCSKK